MADNSKFVIEFKAQMDDLKKAIKQITDFHKKQQTQAKQDKKVSEQDFKMRMRNLDKERKQIRDDRKEERAHNMSMLKQIGNKTKASKKERDDKKKERSEEKQHQKSMLAGLTKAGLAAGGIMLAARALGMVYNFAVGGAQAGYQKYTQYNQALGRSVGMFSGGMGAVHKGIGQASGKYGFNKIETAEMAPLMGRATGVAGPRELQEAMRAGGLQADEAAQFFGTLRRSGSQFTTKEAGEAGAVSGMSQGARQFRDLMALGVASGIEKARLPEFLGGIQELTEQAQSMAGDAVDPTNIAKVAAILGRSGFSGLQGSRGAAVLSGINQGMLSPKSEEAAAAIRQAFGFGLPGGTTDYYSAEKRREQGISGSNNLRDVVNYVGRMGGGNKEQTALMLRSMFGTSLDVNEKLIEAIKTGNKDVIEKAIKEADPLDVQAQKATIELPEFLKHRAKIDDQLLEVGEKVAPLIENLETLETNLLTQVINILNPMLSGLNTIVDFVNSKSPKEVIQDRERKQVAALEEQKKKFTEGVTNPADLFNKAAAMQAAAGSLIGPENEKARAEFMEFAKQVQKIIKSSGALSQKTAPQGLLDTINQYSNTGVNPVMDLSGTVMGDMAAARARAANNAGNKNAGSQAGPTTGPAVVGGDNGYQSITLVVQEGMTAEVQSTSGGDRNPPQIQRR